MLGFKFIWEIGDGMAVPAWYHPVAVVGGLVFQSLSATGNHTCGVTTAKVAYCWGYNGYGELGNGTTAGSAMPVQVKTS